MRRRSWHHRLPIVVTVVILLGVIGPASTLWAGDTPAAYTITKLGTLGGSYSAARGINDAGQVVGWAETPSREEHAFLWSPDDTGMVDLGTLGGSWSVAHVINDIGQVVGVADIASDVGHAFLWSSDTHMVDLSTLERFEDSSSSVAHAVNNVGEVVGVDGYAYGELERIAFLWTVEDGIVDLNTIVANDPGWVLTDALDINNAGQIVGVESRSIAVGAFLLTPISPLPPSPSPPPPSPTPTPTPPADDGTPPPGGETPPQSSPTATLTIPERSPDDYAAFNRTWARTDYPVQQAAANRTWMWGDRYLTAALLEPYVETPGGKRTVRYFDKSRMEVTHPDAVDDGLWYVTNGLLVMELITGRMQVGDAAFIDRQPALLNIAGDPDTGPSYAVLKPLMDDPALAEGTTITQRLAATGAVMDDAGLAARGVTAGRYVLETQHTVATPFWDFMNSSGTVYGDGAVVSDNLFINPFYATGFPVTEAYWTTATVLGTPKDLLIQCFQRRCLTYTPDNPAGWQVEAGNVGLHYYLWRYGTAPVAPASATPVP